MDIQFDTPHRHLELPHGRLAYWCYGEGPDVVFVHGWPLHAATFRHILPAIAKRYRCHLFDLPGAGRTEWADDGPVGLWEHAETLRTALDLLGIEEYASVAHDSGATISRLLATLTPGRVTAIVMGNTEIPGYCPPVLKWGTAGARLPGAARAVQLTLRSRALVEGMFRSCFADIGYLHSGFEDLFVAPLRESVDAVAGQLRLLQNADWSVVEDQLGDVHRAIDTPVLLVWGDRDSWFPWKHAREMVDSFGGPKAEAHVIEGGKLFVHEDFADTFADVALDFLDRARTASAEGARLSA